MLNVKISLDRPLSHAMTRIVRAMESFVPFDISIVPAEALADVVVVHVIGYPETAAACARLKAEGKRYVLAQYCVRSTQEPSTGPWLPLWQDAALVWSYYDLHRLCAEDGHQYPATNFYLSALGVDSRVFAPTPQPKQFLCGTSGYVAESESVGEVVQAAYELQQQVFHLGPRLGPAENVMCWNHITDKFLAALYSRCSYVSGLRRGEGFELPAAEGLLCGARPILFDRPHYRLWYSDWATYIPENEPTQVLDSLRQVFRQPTPAPLSEKERQRAVERFSWETIMHNFWRELRSNL